MPQFLIRAMKAIGLPVKEQKPLPVPFFFPSRISVRQSFPGMAGKKAAVPSHAYPCNRITAPPPGCPCQESQATAPHIHQACLLVYCAAYRYATLPFLHAPAKDPTHYAPALVIRAANAEEPYLPSSVAYSQQRFPAHIVIISLQVNSHPLFLLQHPRCSKRQRTARILFVGLQSCRSTGIPQCMQSMAQRQFQHMETFAHQRIVGLLLQLR